MGFLHDYLTGNRPQALWVDLEDYAWRVFARGAADWRENPARQAGALRMANRVIGAHILTLDASAFFLRSASTLQDGGTPAILVALTDDHAAGLLAESVDAILHALSGSADLILSLDSPADLLARYGDAVDFDAMDDISNRYIELLRPLATRSIAGIVVRTRLPDGVSDDEIEATEPLFKSAQYFGWQCGFELAAGTEVEDFPGNFCLAETGSRKDRLIGAGLNAQFWSGDAPPPAQAFLFGRIPADATPETVSAQAAKLRQEVTA